MFRKEEPILDRKKKNLEAMPDFENEKIREMPVSETLKSNFLPYAMSVIVSRAIPEIDGLKPSHRKVLYTMYEMGLLKGARTKSANIAARTMLLNPHGDAGNHETLVRMTQNNETLLAPLVDGKGNFGKHYSRDMQYAAPRYSEARLMPIAAEFFSSIGKDTVDFVDNYDSTRKEPTLLPVTFPNILANPTEGIAVGMASNIPSFNLAELCDAAVLRIRRPEENVRTVMPAPDFTTGAVLLLDDAAMDKIYETGRGSVKLRAKYTVDTKNRIIEVNEIPYTTTAEAVIEGIISLIKGGKVTEVSDVRNEIDLHGFKIAIDYKRGTDPDALMLKLYKLTKLEDIYSFNMTVLIDGTPRVLGVPQVLDEWLKWRRGCVKRELAFDLKKKQHELHLLEGLAKMLLDIDKAVAIIRNTENDSDVVPALMEGFSIDEEQAGYIAEIKLRNLNRKYIIDKTEAAGRLRKDIETIQKQLSSDKEIDKVIIRTLMDVKKKYGKERKTEIVVAAEAPSLENLPQVSDYPVTIYRTKDGYVKKVAASSMRSNPDIKVKDDDEIVQREETSNTKEILFFTDHGNAYKLYAYEIKDSRPSELGEYMANLLGLEDGENVVYICPLDEGRDVLISFRNGKCARIPLSSYSTKNHRRKLVGAYCGKSPVIGICSVDRNGDGRFAILSSKDRLLVFNPCDIPAKTTRTSQGVQVIRLPAKAEAIAFGKPSDFGVDGKTGYGYRSLPAAGGKYDGQISLFT